MIRWIPPLVCVVLVAGVSLAAETQPRFDPEEVVRRVREARDGADLPGNLTPFSDWGEFLIDTSVTCVSASGDQETPAVAFDGTDFLAVWQDDRNGSYDIYGARITADGVLRDSLGIAISTAANDQAAPAVVFDGTGFFVVWQDERDGSYDIYGARVTRAGVVLDSTGIAVSTAVHDQWWPAVAFHGTGFLVVWQDERDGSSDIYGARVAADGVVLDSMGIAVSTAVYDQWWPAVAFHGTGFLVVWQDERDGSSDIYGARVAADGVVLDSTGIAVSRAADEQCSPRIASGDSCFLVVWQDGRGGEEDDIFGARVTGEGVILDSLGIAFSTAADDQCHPDVAFDGTNFDLVWQDWRGGDPGDIYGARVSGAGIVLDPSGFAVAKVVDDQDAPRLTLAGSGIIAVWQDGRSGSSYDVYGARVSSTGVVQDTSGIPVSTATNDQWFPAVAYDGANFLVVWQDGLGGSSGIYGARVTPGGTVLDPHGIAVCTTASAQHDPALAFDGTNYLVVWEDSRTGPPFDIYGTRITRAGMVLDTSGIAICAAASGQWEPAVAFDGTDYLIVWSDLRRGAFDVYGTRVTKAGVVLDPAGIAVSAAANVQWYPAIVFDGTNYLVVWADFRSGSSYDIFGTRVSRTGVVLDPSGFAVSAAENDQRFPVVAFDGTNSLVAWADARSGQSAGIWGARVDGAGRALDSTGFAIYTAGVDPWYSAMAFDGTDYLVVWTDRRSGSGSDTYGARVTPDGTVADTFPVIRQEGDQWSGTLATATGGPTFVAYGGWAGTVAGKTYRTYRIWGKLGPFPGQTEGPQPSPFSSRPVPSIVRGTVFLPYPVRGQSSPQPAGWLLDALGRRLTDLSPGPNDVSLMPPGVYFVLGNGSAVAQRVTIAQ